jgi:hypothetical protein
MPVDPLSPVAIHKPKSAGDVKRIRRRFFRQIRSPQISRVFVAAIVKWRSLPLRHEATNSHASVKGDEPSPLRQQGWRRLAANRAQPP